eukprot:SAG31_NODE_3829_length_3842_cov_124.370558_1_plen_156_part_00
MLRRRAQLIDAHQALTWCVCCATGKFCLGLSGADCSLSEALAGATNPSKVSALQFRSYCIPVPSAKQYTHLAYASAAEHAAAWNTPGTWWAEIHGLRDRIRQLKRTFQGWRRGGTEANFPPPPPPPPPPLLLLLLPLFLITHSMARQRADSFVRL